MFNVANPADGKTVKDNATGTAVGFNTLFIVTTTGV